jgi:membrane fusion protein (multidrug efflux system)
MTIAAEPQRLRPRDIRAKRNRRLLAVAVVFLLAGLIYAGYWWKTARFWVETDNAYVTGNLVPVAAQASGIVTQVLAEETQFVNRGDLVIRLDEHEAYAELGRARGRLGETVRRIAALFVQQRQLSEKLAARQARLDIVRHDITRYQGASPSGAVSKQIVQNAVDHLRVLVAEVRETKAEYDALDAQIGGTTVMEHPAVELAKNELINAFLEYSRQQIRAPVSGYIAKRKAQVGDRVKPGADLMTIVPLDHLWVEANLRETELRHVRPGQSAIVRVDLYGTQHTYHGTVEGLVPGTGSAFALLPPDNSTGNFIHIVERVPVRIALPQDEIREHPIRPGLSTVTKIHVSESGQSVWSSLAKANTDEYQTDVYAEELTSAESLAGDVIEANMVANVIAAAGSPYPESDSLRSKRVDAPDSSRSPDSVGGKSRYVPRDLTPESHVPPRSPDLGAPTSPLSPSIGPGSGSLGPESGRSPTRFRSGDGIEGGRIVPGSQRSHDRSQ